ADEIMALQAGISRDKLAGLQGEEVEVLVDRPNPEWPALFEGRIWRQAPEVDGIVYVSGEGLAPGRMATAVVEQTMDYDLAALAEPGDDPDGETLKEGGELP
ncbi:MAG: hypothetical protein ACOCVM_01200, partial [Desulfovibrionaceae bacterium]